MLLRLQTEKCRSQGLITTKRPRVARWDLPFESLAQLPLTEATEYRPTCQPEDQISHRWQWQAHLAPSHGIHALYQMSSRGCYACHPKAPRIGIARVYFHKIGPH